jgi:glycosyltransferase involved in cell wall biosynthesis
VEKQLKMILAIPCLKDGGAEHVMIMLANYFHRNKICVKLLVTNQKKSQAILKGLSNEIEVDYIEDNILQYTPRKVKGLICSGLCKGFEKLKKNVPDFLARDSFEEYYGAYIFQIKDYLNNHKEWTVLAFLQPTNQLILYANESNRIFLSERADPYRYFRTRYANFFINKYYRNLNGIIFQTKESFKAYNDRIAVGGVIIPNPVPNSLPEVWWGPREKTVVNFCRLSKQKNIPLLIEAFEIFERNHSDYSLIIYGDGELKDSLVELIGRNRCSNKIKLLTHQANIHEKVRKAGMFVSSSDYEGMSNSMLEAMALGLPVVCTDCPIGGASAVISNYENGILVSVNDVNALSIAMSNIADSQELANKLSKNAAEIRETLSEEQVCNQWLEYLQQ